MPFANIHIDSILLDLDGPVLNGKYRHYRCYSDILREYGFRALNVDEYWKMKRNRQDRRQQLAATGAERIYDLFLKRWIELIEQKNYLALDIVQEGVVEKLLSWKSAGISIFLVTLRNNNSNLFWQLESNNLLPFFDKVLAVGTEAGSKGKESAASSVLAEKMVSALWIGDTEVDVVAARALGIKVCAVSCGLRTSEYLSTLKPDFLLPDIKSINFTEMESL